MLRSFFNCIRRNYQRFLPLRRLPLLLPSRRFLLLVIGSVPLLEKATEVVITEDFYKQLRNFINKQPDGIKTVQLKLLTPLPILRGSDQKRKANLIFRDPNSKAMRRLYEIIASGNDLVMFSGGSATGKTTALANILSAPFKSPSNPQQYVVPIVCHIDLRQASSKEDFLTRLRSSVGLDEPQHSSLQMRDLLKLLYQAFDQLVSNDSTVKACPVIWVEDIHDCDLESAQELSNALLRANASVIHTVSEDTGFRRLETLSGHAARLDHLEFPPLTESEIVKGLSEPSSFLRHGLEVDQSASVIVPIDRVRQIEQAPVCSAAVARKLTHFFGTNLGQIDKFFTKPIEDNSELDSRIHDEIKKEVSRLSLLTSTTSMYENSPEFVVALHTILDALLRNEGNPVNADRLVTQIITDPAKDVRGLIQKMINLNLLAFDDVVEADFDAVMAKRKAIIHAWKIATKRSKVEIARSLLNKK